MDWIKDLDCNAATKANVRKYCKKYNITELKDIPRCNCGKFAFYRAQDGINYCSPKCSKGGKRLPVEISNILDNKENLLEIVNKLGTTQAAQHLNISAGYLANTLKTKHNVDMNTVGSRKNTSAARNILTEELFKKEYITNNLTYKQIAEKYNTSVNNITTIAKKYNIIPKKPNEYDREVSFSSKGEEEIKEFIESIYTGEIKTKNRSILQGGEIDIYLPEINFAIEFNGLAFHSYRLYDPESIYNKGRLYHYNKSRKCLDKDILLFHIFEDEWYHKKEIVKSIIRYNLNKIDNNYYARKLSIQEIDNTIAHQFLLDNHLQGDANFSKAYGLCGQNNLISLMTFSQNTKNNNVQWELNRFCSLKNTNVVGGFSKLLKHYEREIGKDLISYSDFRRSHGKIYENNGFNKIKENPPGYQYVKNLNYRKHRTYGLKKNLMKYLPEEDHNLTEFEMAAKLKLAIIWNCGTWTWLKKFKQ